jgi:hypothetical protein
MFYTIYKNQGNHFTIGVTLLQGGPRKDPWLCNVVPRRPAGAGCSIPASSPPGLARGRRGRGLRVTSGRFGDSVRARSSRQGGHAGGQGGAAAAAAGFQQGRIGEGYGRLGWLV